jgi:hypothetical protein
VYVPTYIKNQSPGRGGRINYHYSTPYTSKGSYTVALQHLQRRIAVETAVVQSTPQYSAYTSKYYHQQLAPFSNTASACQLRRTVAAVAAAVAVVAARAGLATAALGVVWHAVHGGLRPLSALNRSPPPQRLGDAACIVKSRSAKKLTTASCTPGLMKRTPRM